MMSKKAVSQVRHRFHHQVMSSPLFRQREQRHVFCVRARTCVYRKPYPS